MCQFDYQFRMIPGIPFRNAVITSDNNHIVVVSIDKTSKDCICVYSVTGNYLHKIPLRGYNIKVINLRIAIENLLLNASFLSTIGSVDCYPVAA